MAGFCTPVRAWWESKFHEMSAPQRLAVPAIHAGRHTLVCAPTGSGKTLCAFISILSDLFARLPATAATGKDDVGIDTVYISPLRALGTDVAKNLLVPLEEVARGMGYAEELPIRVGQRTGDTTPKERRHLIRRPPHILVTTPESLALCLAQGAMRAHLRGVRRIIVDELHSVAANKRGVDLMLSVERLSDLVAGHGGADPQRIGLSATIAPLDRMAEFLVGSAHAGRCCAIADASFDRPLELEITSVFGKTPFATTAAINRHVYDLLERTIRSHRTTLVFTNLRAATERVTFALRKRFANALEAGTYDEIVHPDQIAAHHSSLDRDVRLDIERRLKAGELRCVVCSTSLELGIDIGTIDRVVLLNSPKGVARGLQRVGRSGHSLTGTACGTFVPTVPADLIEAMVTADAMRQRAVDAIEIPRNATDVLAQHLIGMAIQAAPHGIHTDHAYAIARRTFSFADLAREKFDDVVRYIATPELRDTTHVAARLWIEPAETDDHASHGVQASACGEEQAKACTPYARGLLHPLRRSIAGLYAQNVGTITQEGQVKVKIKDGGVIGSIEEAFAQVLKPGDRFVLGGRCVCFVAAHGMTAEVIESGGQTPTVPRWYSGTMAMEPGLAARMRSFRAKVRAIAPAGESAIARMLMRQFTVSEETARPAAAFLHAQFRYADIPIDGQLLVERVPDEGAIVLVFHTMIGRAANEALARAVAYRMHQRFNVGRAAAQGATVVVDDYAFGIWIEQSTAARRADRALIRSLLSAEAFQDDLAAAVETSELFRTQFRFTAIRAHAILQHHFGRRRFIGQMQSYASRLYEALRDFHPGHLLLTETRRSVMEDVLAAPAAERFLAGLSGTALRLIDLPSPSPFAFGLFATGRRDTLALADTADFLLAMYQQVQRRLGSRAAVANPQAELFS